MFQRVVIQHKSLSQQSQINKTKQLPDSSAVLIKPRCTALDLEKSVFLGLCRGD